MIRAAASVACASAETLPCSGISLPSLPLGAPRKQELPIFGQTA